MWFQKYKNVRYFALMFRDQVKFSFKRKISRFTLIGFALIFLLPACAPDKTPAGVLSEQEMVKILAEIYLAEEKTERAGIPYDSARKIFPKFEAKIYEKMSVSDSVFLKSMEYYKAHPKKLDYIYSALVDSLNLQAQREPAPHTK
jgi:hypothetical protein